MNPASLETLTGVKVEPSVATAAPGTRYQFERLGYFCVDADSGQRPQATGHRLVFNRTVTLKDSWAKAVKG
jgi:glutaminyl-tRNA synthetase